MFFLTLLACLETSIPSPAVPGAAPPSTGVPTATVPTATVPTATVPTATVPSATVPSATVPSATVPPTTTPSGSVPIAAPSTPPGATPQAPGFVPGALEAAERLDPGRAAVVRRSGATVRPTPDGRSFYLVRRGSRVGAGTVVTLPGHATTAFEGFAAWDDYVAARGMGLIALQWWDATADSNPHYLPAPVVYPTLTAILSAEGVPPKTALLHGFSRGATQVYLLAALDRDDDRFAMFFANAGQASSDLPLLKEVSSGALGSAVYAGTRWILYCGAGDEGHGNCEAMERSARWLEQNGAEKPLFLRGTGHGGFHQSSPLVTTALDAYAAVLGAG